MTISHQTANLPPNCVLFGLSKLYVMFVYSLNLYKYSTQVFIFLYIFCSHFNVKVSGRGGSRCGNPRVNLLVLVRWEEIQQQPTNRPPAPLVAVEIQACSVWDVLRREALVLLREAPRSSGLSFYCVFFFNLSDVFDAKAFISFY